MANAVLNNSLIAKAALAILDGEMTLAKRVYRGYEDEFSNNVNGYKPGDTITIRRPTDFTVGSGATATAQDVVEGSTTITVDQQKHVMFEFTGSQLTLSIGELSERVIKPAMVQLAAEIESDILSLYRYVPNWVGTPGQTVNSFTDFSKAPERLGSMNVPRDNRYGALSSADHWGLLGNQSGLYIENAASGAYRDGSLGRIGGVETFETTLAPTHTVGVATGTPLVQGGSQTSTYASVKATMTQTLNTDGWTNSTTGILKAGDVFTIAGVYAVHPVTKDTLGFLRQFVVMADADSGATTGPAALTIYPAIITSGAFKTCSAAPADNAAITVLGTGGTGYTQNLVFHKNAFALCMVPMVRPAGGVDFARESYKGMSANLVSDFDTVNYKNIYRLDVLYGFKAIDPRLATRLSGTA